MRFSALKKNHVCTFTILEKANGGNVATRRVAHKLFSPHSCSNSEIHILYVCELPLCSARRSNGLYKIPQFHNARFELGERAEFGKSENVFPRTLTTPHVIFHANDHQNRRVSFIFCGHTLYIYQMYSAIPHSALSIQNGKCDIMSNTHEAHLRTLHL